MDKPGDIISQKVWNSKQLVTAILITGSVVFSGTLIWTRFLFMEEEIKTNEDRATKRYHRQQEENVKFWNEFNKSKE